ncbi:CHAP domain-containing protein [Galbitalea sp. SE-J8]|uniref:CHAP domain-containing protein n=1 Tax=Galbitalea sp. SE-J8 TaxID=3054952 RepID=UPI00259CE797|nr:CHAP domain-containing protein [Galbitalea sp. SE-J8]MDM4762396.1 CHAP domain-containing protein [Galbitalea sp. SE-J8]
MVDVLTPGTGPASTDPFPTRRSLREHAASSTARTRTDAAPAVPRAPASVDARPALPPVSARPARPLRRPSAQRPSVQRRLAGVLAVLVIPGIVAGTSIPSFAIANASGASDHYVAADAQDGIVVADDATGATAARADFDATSEQDLRDARAALRARLFPRSAAASDGGFSTVDGPRAPGDDYPWRNSGGLSPLGYVIRQCTDFVAWRLNQDAGSKGGDYKLVWSVMTPGGGSASQWASQWKRNGWKTSHTPVRGAVAWFYGNHVAYVKSVAGDQVNLEEYNWGGDGAYHTRTIDVSDVALFLYPPPV